MMGILLSASCASSRKGVSIYSVTVDREFPHDTSSYTQGLFFHGGALYESAGQYGHSNMRKVDLESGKPLFRHDFDDRYFLEGSTILDGKLF
ncbi:MAG: glutaminyl-peptide cyclotransferase, partial [Bacteroidales bacterium]|nr:glutaminyl-peptide cyclotransferase [Bacteroidales bacterium]